MTGPKWFSFTAPPHNGASPPVLHIASKDIPADVYVSVGAHSDPNPFSYDMHFKGQSNLSLHPRMLPALASNDGFTVTVYVRAIDEAANKLLDNTLNVRFASEPRSRGGFFNEAAAMFGI